MRDELGDRTPTCETDVEDDGEATPVLSPISFESLSEPDISEEARWTDSVEQRVCVLTPDVSSDLYFILSEQPESVKTETSEEPWLKVEKEEVLDHIG